MRPKRTDDKYWTGTRNFNHIQYESDLEDYIIDLENEAEQLRLGAVTSSAVKKNGKILITEKQKQQFNIMLNALKKIKAYQTPDRLRKDSEKDWGLDFEEAIEMAYENIQGEAAFASKNVKPLQ